MTDAPLFHYISPKLLPVFPGQTGAISCLIDPQFTLDVRARKTFSGTAAVSFEVFAEGEKLSEEVLELEVIDGKVQHGPILRTYEAPSMGYVEIGFGCSEPLFSKIVPEPGYAVLTSPGRGSLTVNTDMKYANPRVIQQIKKYHRFCMLHSEVYSDAKHGAGNSLMLINPYEQVIVTKIYADRKTFISRKVPPKSATMVDFRELFEDGEVGTVMLTANNRVITYDVRHAYGDQTKINSIDHLDPFSGFSTLSSLTAEQFARSKLRAFLRAVGIRPD